MRRSRENGIWLCQNCGKLVDADPSKYSVETLRAWKHEAQARAFRALVTAGPSSFADEAARIGKLIATDNPNASDARYPATFDQVHSAATGDLDSYVRGSVWKSYSIQLTLRLHDDATAPPFSISQLPLAVEVAPEVTIVAAPGTGKTTTLLQLAEHVLAVGSIVPLYYRLPEWSASSASLLDSLLHRSAFKNVTPEDMRLLAERGRILLLLDGWNELVPAARRRLRIELQQMRRNWPDVRIIVTTRKQVLDVPISGPRIAIESLSDDQQMEIAGAQYGAMGEKVVDDAWRTVGVRELIGIPLYLAALLSSGFRGGHPTTKEEILRLFVQEHELSSDHAEALLECLANRHAFVLTALASHLNAVGSTSIAEVDARQVVMAAVTQLRDLGQIAELPEPLDVLEVLTSHHALMRSTSDGNAIAFQHQQFQEWYASHEVSRLMRLSARGDENARARLRAAVLDQPAWEESVYFAVERLPVEDEGVAVVAHAIRLALPIDPMLAAEMIFRAPPSVWDLLKGDVMAFVDRWHVPGHVDRALRFMIITGRPEFEALVWPLASSVDSQIQLPTFRTAPRFRPSVFGPDVRKKIGALGQEERRGFLGLMAAQSGVDGMDLATELAKADPSPAVQAEVARELQFRSAYRHMKDLLSEAHGETWALIAKFGYVDEIRDPMLAERLVAERAKVVTATIDPLERLRVLLDQSSDYPGRDDGIVAAIADPAFPLKDANGGSSLNFIQRHAPIALARGLCRRVEAGLRLPYYSKDFLDQLEVVDRGPIATEILNVRSDNWNADEIATMAGPEIVGALIDAHLACVRAWKNARSDRTLADQERRLRVRISATREASFIAAVITRGSTSDLEVIALLASAVFEHGDNDARNRPIGVTPADKAKLMEVLRSWVNVVASSKCSKRYDLSNVSNAIGRLGFRELVPELRQLLDEDLARLKTAIAQRQDASRRGDIEAASDAAMRYGNQYREALVRLGGDRVADVAAQYLESRLFGFDAALVLKAISDRELNTVEPDFHRRWPRFDEVAAARVTRASSPRPEPTNSYAAPIFEAIDRLAHPDVDVEGQLLAIRLARIALAMPHSNQDALIARVLELPQPIKTKWELFAAIALDGQVLDVAPIMGWIEDWIAESQSSHSAWHRKQNTWEIEPWLELLAFTTDPASVIEGLTKVKAFYGSGHRQLWQRVLAAVAGVPGAEGEALLAGLARAHKDIASESEWRGAILRRESASAVRLYMDLYTEGLFGHGADVWHVGRSRTRSVCQEVP